MKKILFYCMLFALFITLILATYSTKIAFADFTISYDCMIPYTNYVFCEPEDSENRCSTTPSYNPAGPYDFISTTYDCVDHPTGTAIAAYCEMKNVFGYIFNDYKNETDGQVMATVTSNKWTFVTDKTEHSSYCTNAACCKTCQHHFYGD